MNKVDQEKKLARERFLSIVRALDGVYARGQSARAQAVLTSSRLWEDAASVFLFLSIKGEIDTSGVIERCIIDKKTLLLPRAAPAIKRGGRLDPPFAVVDKIPGVWARGPFGIREPPSNFPNAIYRELSRPLLIVVPGLAFSSAGERLGRGGGFYDRFLSECEKIYEPREYIAAGLCFNEQLTDRVPVDGRDQKMDYIIAPEKIIKTGRRL